MPAVVHFPLFARSDQPYVVYFLLVLIPVEGMTLYTVLKSRRLSDFLETLAEEHRPSKEKVAAILAVWKAKRGRDS